MTVSRFSTTGTLGLLAAALLLAAPAQPAEMPTLEAFAMKPVVTGVGLSPSGKHLAMRRLPARDGDYAIHIYETENLAKKPYVLGAEHMKITGYSWANDERLLVYAQQLVEIPGDRAGYATAAFGAPGRVKVTANKLLSVGLDGGPWIELPRKNEIARFASEVYQERLGRPSVVSRLSDEEDWVLVEWENASQTGSDLFKINVKNGRLKSVFKQSNNYFGYSVDKDQEVRFRQRYNSDDTITLEYRLKGSDEWQDWASWDVASRKPISFLRFATDFEGGGPNKVLALASYERDTEGIYMYDLEDLSQPPELLFATDRYDVGGTLTRRDAKNPYGSVVGFYYNGEGPQRHYLDENAAALQKSIDNALPPGVYNTIMDRADDDKYIVIRSMGTREPGRYYLLKDGKSLEYLGQRAPIESKQLGERRSIWYTARDGTKLNAVLTLPTFGEPPYPTIAHPHGGPWSRDFLWWDEWAQVLATRGYAVLQPNFRGSTGFGAEYRDIGDAKWGYEMQDDVDDGVLHLVEQGIADPERMAIFGWSYGGYSAMVGSLRKPNLYRCSIPGAGVASMELIQKERHGRRFIEVFQAPSTAGLSPIKHVEDVNVPVLLVHGDRDLIVDVEHSDMFARELKRLNKPHRYLRLADAGHTFSTLKYDHLLSFYKEMIDFLATDCGMNPGTPTASAQ